MHVWCLQLFVIFWLPLILHRLSLQQFLLSARSVLTICMASPLVTTFPMATPSWTCTCWMEPNRVAQCVWTARPGVSISRQPRVMPTRTIGKYISKAVAGLCDCLDYIVGIRADRKTHTSQGVTTKWTVGVDPMEDWALPRTGVLLAAWEDFFRATAPRTRCVVFCLLHSRSVLS